MPEYRHCCNVCCETGRIPLECCNELSGGDYTIPKRIRVQIGADGTGNYWYPPGFEFELGLRSITFEYSYWGCIPVNNGIHPFGFDIMCIPGDGGGIPPRLAYRYMDWPRNGCTPSTTDTAPDISHPPNTVGMVPFDDNHPCDFFAPGFTLTFTASSVFPPDSDAYTVTITEAF